MKYKKEFTSEKTNPHSLLKDGELLAQTEIAAKKEKDATLSLLEYLVEVDARKLYATKSYSSLFEYIVKDLKLSEPAAAERVNAVRLMRAVPEVKAHLKNGRMSLSNAAQIQRFFRNEEKSSAKSESKFSTQSEKVIIISECLDLSKREVEKTLLSKQSEPAKNLSEEKIKLISSKRSEIRFTIDEETYQKIGRVKELLGDVSLEFIFDRSLSALIEKEEQKRGMARQDLSRKNSLIRDIGHAEDIMNKPTDVIYAHLYPNDHIANSSLQKNDYGFFVDSKKSDSGMIHPKMANSKKVDSKKESAEKLSKPAAASDPIESHSTRPAEFETSTDDQSETMSNEKSENSRYIPANFKRIIFARSNGQCEYTDSKSARRCTSRYRIQIDHIYPFALGGKTELGNLRALCPAHNQRAAMQWNLNRAEKHNLPPDSPIVH